MSTNQTPIIVEDVTISGRDMFLPAAVLFLAAYYPLCLFIQALGVYDVLFGNIILLGIYSLIYLVLFTTKYYMSMTNGPISYLVKLLDCNIGLQACNILIILLSLVCAVACCLTGNGILFSAFFVIIIAFAVNLGVGKKYWDLSEPGSAWIPYHSPNFQPAMPNAPQGKKLVKKTFSWNDVLKSMGLNPKDANDVEVCFLEPDYLDEQSADYVRKDNPFFNAQPQTENDYPKFASVVKSGCKDPFEKAAVSQIIQSAEDLCRKYNLPDYEMYDLLLKFCQFNIKYVVDEQSAAIGNRLEYFRFSSETLFDVEGDCDCKSVLAYNLFSTLGADVELVCVCMQGDDNPNNALNHAAIILRDNGNKIPIPSSFPLEKLGNVGKAVYCDATASGFNPGACPSELVKDSVTII